MNRALGYLGAVAVIALTGCVTTETQGPATTSMEYKLPTLTPVEPTKQSQEKDGIRISAAAYSYATTQNVRKEYRLRSFTAAFNQVPADVREITTVSVTPSDVRFKVKINNQLERVLRLAGAVVSFQVAGKSAAVPKAKYDDFLAGIILPRQEGEYEIVGPELSQIPDNATIAFFLYDIVTATDAAGNPTKRSNFEFFYTLQRQPKTLEIPNTAIRRDYVSVPMATLIQQRMRTAPDGWVSLSDQELAAVNAAGAMQPMAQPTHRVKRKIF